MKAWIIVVTGAVLLGAGCATEEAFPLINEDPGYGEQAYYVCADGESGARLYMSSRCGDDTCFDAIYDRFGVLIDEGEFGMEEEEPKVHVEQCQRTTEEYFGSKVSE